MPIVICLSLAFKRCVTTFLSRERECDESHLGQGNWSIVDQEVIHRVTPFRPVIDRRLFQYHTTVITGYVFDGIKGYNVPNYVFENLVEFLSLDSMAQLQSSSI